MPCTAGDISVLSFSKANDLITSACLMDKLVSPFTILHVCIVLIYTINNYTIIMLLVTNYWY